MILTSPSFRDGEMIPKKFTCDGGDINPELQIQNIPAEAKSLALVLHDPDAPVSGGFTHWILWNIKSTTTLIKDESVPTGSVEGKNTAGQNQYAGPCPPSGTHHYEFTLYALNATLEMPETTATADAWNEIRKHAIAETKLMGLYARGTTN